MMDNDGTGVSWKVTSQQEVTDRGPSGAYEPGVRISFSTANGSSGSIFVPTSQYNADNVRRLINDRVAAMSSIGGLSG